MSARHRGLYSKFRVSRTDGTDGAGQKHDGCRYFVLDLTHDPLATPAVQAYSAAARADGYVALADDLDQIARPRVVATLAEMNALPEGSIIMRPDRGRVWRRERGWWVSDDGLRYSIAAAAPVEGSHHVVLWSPPTESGETR